MGDDESIAQGAPDPAVASLPWYFFDEISWAYDVLWRHLAESLDAAGFESVPEALSSHRNYRAHWASENLLLTQCCGYHIASRAQNLRVIGVPFFDVGNDGQPGRYRSLIVKRKDSRGRSILDFKGKRAVYNDNQSFSGHTALLCTVPRDRLNSEYFVAADGAGSHLDSVRRIISGDADVAAIDAVTYQIIMDHWPNLAEQLEIIEETILAPAPPYVTSSKRDDHEINILRDVLVEVSHSPDEDLKAALAAMHIREIVDATNEDYLPMAETIRTVETAFVRAS